MLGRVKDAVSFWPMILVQDKARKELFSQNLLKIEPLILLILYPVLTHETLAR
jgi:hypothetical protein